MTRLKDRLKGLTDAEKLLVIADEIDAYNHITAAKELRLMAAAKREREANA